MTGGDILPAADEIKLGVSACLTGEEVRYDGGHRRSSFVTDILARHFTLVTVCPEVGVGMTVPRETVDLQGDPAAPRMIASETGRDWTAPMNRWCRSRVRELEDENLCGFVFKRNSPSCGVFGVPVFDREGGSSRPGSGMFVLEYRRRKPLVPVEEEERLEDDRWRENFLERVFAYRRLTGVFAGRWKRSAVVDFHRRERYLLMAHGPGRLRQLDSLAAPTDGRPVRGLKGSYMAGFMAALAIPATLAGHAGAMRHLAGTLRGHFHESELDRLDGLIREYRAGRIPLAVPMALLKQLAAEDRVPDLADQTYLAPVPQQLRPPDSPA